MGPTDRMRPLFLLSFGFLLLSLICCRSYSMAHDESVKCASTIGRTTKLPINRSGLCRCTGGCVRRNCFSLISIDKSITFIGCRCTIFNAIPSNLPSHETRRFYVCLTHSTHMQWARCDLASADWDAGCAALSSIRSLTPYNRAKENRGKSIRTCSLPHSVPFGIRVYVSKQPNKINVYVILWNVWRRHQLRDVINRLGWHELHNISGHRPVVVQPERYLRHQLNGKNLKYELKLYSFAINYSIVLLCRRYTFYGFRFCSWWSRRTDFLTAWYGSRCLLWVLPDHFKTINCDVSGKVLHCCTSIEMRNSVVFRLSGW